MGIDDTVLRLVRRHRRSIPQLYAQFDAIFIIDSSGSIRRRDYYRTMKAMQLLTGKAQNSRRYAAITFSNNATIRFDFTERKEAVNNLRKIPLNVA